MNENDPFKAPYDNFGVDFFTNEHADFIPDDNYIEVGPFFLVNKKTYEKMRLTLSGPEFDEYIKNTLKVSRNDRP
jgi:hypothetical protein